MDPSKRIVIGPVHELFDVLGVVEAHEIGELTAEGVRSLLRDGAVGAIARLGFEIEWLEGRELFDWWKEEVRPRLWDPDDRPRLEDYPGERAWSATEWRRDDGRPIVCFEDWH